MNILKPRCIHTNLTIFSGERWKHHRSKARKINTIEIFFTVEQVIHIYPFSHFSIDSTITFKAPYICENQMYLVNKTFMKIGFSLVNKDGIVPPDNSYVSTVNNIPHRQDNSFIEEEASFRSLGF